MYFISKLVIRILNLKSSSFPCNETKEGLLYVHPGVLAFGYVKMTMPLLLLLLLPLPAADCSCSVFSVTDLPPSVVTSILPISESRSMVSPTARSLPPPPATAAGEAVDDSAFPLAVVSLDFLTLAVEARRLVGGGGAAADVAVAGAGLLRSSTIISNL